MCSLIYYIEYIHVCMYVFLLCNYNVLILRMLSKYENLDVHTVDTYTYVSMHNYVLVYTHTYVHFIYIPGPSEVVRLVRF